MSDFQTQFPQVDVAALEVEGELRRHLERVYWMMAAGLLITAAVAYLLSRDPSVAEFARGNPAGLQVLFLFEIVVVAFVSKAVDKLSLAATAVTFYGYSVLNGFTFAVFFVWLPPASIAFGFGLTALTFSAMALYGHLTQRDLGTLRSFFLMVLTGVASLVLLNLAFRNPMAYWATAYLGVMAFSGLTSYHAQSMRDLEWEFDDDDEDRCKAMYASALMLYLDFVNLYILIMRFAGSARSNRVR